MELPVITTNWSGPTAFLNEQVAYPLAIDGLSVVKSDGVSEARCCCCCSAAVNDNIICCKLLLRLAATGEGRAQTAGTHVSPILTCLS